MINRPIFTMIMAYLLWSTLPLYLHLLNQVSPVEILIHRSFWSMILLILVLALRKKIASFWFLLLDKKTFLHLFFSALFLTLNWGLFVYAVVIGDVLSTSLAYFICPIFVMAVAVFIYQEKLNLLQWLSVILVIFSIFYRLIMANDFPFIALVIALSWTTYVILQKKFVVATLERLTIETIIIVPILAIIFYFWSEANSYSSHFVGIDDTNSLLLIGAGAVTILPLILFNSSIKQVPVKLISILQYIVPSLSFLAAIFILGESLDFQVLISFGIIWLAILFFLLGQKYQSTAEKLSATKVQ